ncbi:DUF1963 domain-containing protein [Nocardioides ochotonae]|uniref:DUF1963 domain-containing protein n=1 Tax=Nocardioides ochotonae TaxID=2685869 RepID=UPI001409AFF5|nr:DUF1963 domain-containing protein [Nocardioides ochotonae]
MTSYDDVRGLWVDHVQRTRTWSEDRSHAVYMSLVQQVVEMLRGQPELAPQLLEALRQADPESDWHSFLYAVLVPNRMLAMEDPDAFRAHPEVAFSAEQMPIRVAAALVRMTAFPKTDDEAELARYTRSWFGGRPLAPAGEEWPRRADGTPLAHVVQVDLNDDWEMMRPEIGLPSRGLLQVFHDLETYGNPEDAGDVAWRVRWFDTDDFDGFAPTARPDDLPIPACTGPLAARPSPMATVPSVLDLHHPDQDTWDRYKRIQTWLENYPYTHNRLMAPDLAATSSPWGGDPSRLVPVSRLCGYGYNEFNPDYQKILDAQLPLSVGDEHVMFADINPGQFTDEDWFHGQRHLQIWMRRSDLAERRFDDCWAFIRLDG